VLGLIRRLEPMPNRHTALESFRPSSRLSSFPFERTQVSGELPWLQALWQLVSLPIITDNARSHGWKRPPKPKYHPRPMNGIAVAITVMNSTFASSGRLAM
jgi:hypothetical protein